MKLFLFFIVIFVAIIANVNGQVEERLTTARPPRVNPFEGIDACDQPNHFGGASGRAFFRRVYYNKAENECQSFVFGGGRQTENNFRTQEECEARCLVVAATEE